MADFAIACFAWLMFYPYASKMAFGIPVIAILRKCILSLISKTHECISWVWIGKGNMCSEGRGGDLTINTLDYGSNGPGSSPRAGALRRVLGQDALL